MVVSGQLVEEGIFRKQAAGAVHKDQWLAAARIEDVDLGSASRLDHAAVHSGILAS